MASKDVKLLAVEIDGVDLDCQEEYLLHSEDAEFTGAGFTATKAQQAVIEAKAGFPSKAGTVTGASFTGNPKKFTVTFSTAFGGTNYAIEIKGADARTWSYESKLAGSFVINANANQALAGEVSWTATETGEHG